MKFFSDPVNEGEKITNHPDSYCSEFNRDSIKFGKSIEEDLSSGVSPLRDHLPAEIANGSRGE